VANYKWLLSKNMNRESNHFRGESFGAADSIEENNDEYLKNLINYYKSCFVLEKSGKNTEELVTLVRSIEREINLLSDWNSRLEETTEKQDFDIQMIQEDIKNTEEELLAVDKERKQLEEKIEGLYRQKALKDAIIQRQDGILYTRSERMSTPKKVVSKTSRNRYESPTLV
jgi:chromosome segregation ATPase